MEDHPTKGQGGGFVYVAAHGINLYRVKRLAAIQRQVVSLGRYLANENYDLTSTRFCCTVASISPSLAYASTPTRPWQGPVETMTKIAGNDGASVWHIAGPNPGAEQRWSYDCPKYGRRKEVIVETSYL
ncbi:hypothetical protein KM043_009585 [Ampulex compressa]|nr:hypothetical protein KM043_009585 [Ampulex compressa]